MNQWAYYKKELHRELVSILQYWSTHVLDEETGTITGYIDFYGKKNPDENIGIIMVSRMLWTFSAACKFYNSQEYRVHADMCKTYIDTYFYDHTYGGYIWEISASGTPIVQKKQIYAQAFVLYALAEYYDATKDEQVLHQAMQLFNAIESYAFDAIHGGYFEAFSQSWQKLDDVRLSSKDLNLPKGMNTNLHILEAYTRLYQVTNDTKVKDALAQQTLLYAQKIVAANGHVHIFFNDSWEVQTHEYSYGHDIESSWLLWEAAEIIGDDSILNTIRPIVLTMVKTFIQEGIDTASSAVIYEYFTLTNSHDLDRHWWVQVEAMEGLANAYQMTKNHNYRTLLFAIWNYVKTNIIDEKNGEWHWRTNRENIAVNDSPKVSMWKCPYHNSRALMRLLEKIELWETEA